MRLTVRYVLIAISLLLMGVSCEDAPVKIYFVDVNQGGLYRKQDEELVPFQKILDKELVYFAASKEDWEWIAQNCKAND